MGLYEKVKIGLLSIPVVMSISCTNTQQVSELEQQLESAQEEVQSVRQEFGHAYNAFLSLQKELDQASTTHPEPFASFRYVCRLGKRSSAQNREINAWFYSNDGKSRNKKTMTKDISVMVTIPAGRINYNIDKNERFGAIHLQYNSCDLWQIVPIGESGYRSALALIRWIFSSSKDNSRFLSLLQLESWERDVFGEEQ